MKRARISGVWHYFEVDSEEQKIAKCAVCQSKISFKATVSNLNKHLKNKHLITITPHITTQPEITQQQPLNSSKPTNTQDFSTIPLTVQPSTSAATDPQAELPSRSTEQTNSKASNPRPIINPVQQTIKIFSSIKKISAKQRKENDDALMMLFSKSFLPFSIVEDDYFKKFVEKLNPAYQLPSRKHVSKTLLDAEYLSCVNQVKENLVQVDSLCLTIDCWTSRAQEGYLAATAHYINQEFELETSLLQCYTLTGPHTAVNLSRELNDIVNEWKLDKKIRLVVSDNAPNVQNCIKELQLKNFGCFAHTINLIAKNSLNLPDVELFLTKLRAIVSHFRRSNTAIEKLLKYQLNNNVSQPKKMIIDVATRWNSTFYMLERALLLKEALISTLAILDSSSSSSLENLTADEWKMCKDLCTVLKPLEQVTVQISGEKYLTGSLVIVFNRLLVNVYSNKISDDGTLHSSAVDVSKRILRGIKSRLNNIEMSGTFSVATFLDPRYKTAFFLDKVAAESAKKKVTDMAVYEINKEWATATSTTTTTTPPTAPMTATTLSDTGTLAQSKPYDFIDIWEDMDVQTVQTLESPLAIAIAEVERYLNNTILPRNMNPNDWWRKNGFLYPNLTKLFKKHCCVLATSVPCERIFSKTGELISDRRTRLTSDKVKKIMFLYMNKK